MSEIVDYEEYNIDDDDVLLDGDPNRLYSVPSGGSTTLDNLSNSTNAMGDNDLIVTKENGGTDWVKKTASKVWNYIKNKLGIADSGNTFLRKDGTWATPQDTTYGVVSKTANGLAPQLPNETTTTKYLRQDGTWATPPDNNDNNAVTQTATSTDANYEVLFSATADNTTRTEGARKSSSLKFNPSTGNLSTTKLNGYTPSTANSATTVALRDSNGNINAQKFNGYAISSSADASTLALRNSSGYLYSVFYNMTNAGRQNPASYTAYAAFVDSNGWLRQSTLANFNSWTGLSNVGASVSGKTANVALYNGGTAKTGSAVTATIYRINPSSKIGVFGVSCEVTTTFSNTNNTVKLKMAFSGLTPSGYTIDAWVAGDGGSFKMYCGSYEDIWVHTSFTSGSRTAVVRLVGICTFT